MEAIELATTHLREVLARGHWRIGVAVVGVAALLAALSAFDYAGSASDGSRFAAAESLVDRSTFAIDQSVFVVPRPEAGKPEPYNSRVVELENGTVDKVLIGGHFYSDKGPVLALILAAVYCSAQVASGLTVHGQPDVFCKVLTAGTAGVAYVVAVFSIWRLFGKTPVTLQRRLLLTALFALGTLALPYMRNVNNHIALLGVAAPLFLGLDTLARNPNRRHSWLALGSGCLAGLGYTLDQAAGPPLIGAVALIAYRTRSLGSVLLFALGAVPWLALHHIVTYEIGGTIGPYSAVPEYYRWPGSPFDESNLTGVWGNQGVWGTITYAAEMLFLSKRSFLLNNLPLLLLLPALLVLCRRHREVEEWPELLFAFVWCLATVSIYAVGSTGYGGICTSIRWFIPLLAAGFYTIAVALRYEPNYLGHLLTLGFWSFLVGGFLWYQGAWLDHSVASLWIVQIVGSTLWFADRLWPWWRAGSPDPPVRKDFGQGARTT